ncbi:MBL fold metallo-hydrolase [Mycolicibacterium setense]|uniref:MBL fold metallo-hydrolase n=1 Tax=Mycolicibacterium setense TaxID=431269 RepID=UPI0007EA382C|nr:MBL fold metallo-hydrolase [Mycolicibacterium setense]OBB14649.1 MBL fold metallo-hydrolase [Mycolicibacterium setense]
MPPIEQVKPGLWSIPVPLPMTSLRYVLVYAFETNNGAYLVDAGWDTEDAWDGLVAGLAVAGISITDVRGVLATHVHPDHYGLAGRIRAVSGAWIGLHPADAHLIADPDTRADRHIPIAREDYRRAGAPPDEIDALGTEAMAIGGLDYAVTPDRLIEDGARVDIADWDITALWTPGHSPGHLCFRVPQARAVLTGDHVLPRISPNIAASPWAGTDPLGDYLDSLDKLAAYDDDLLALPAHEHRFSGLAQRISDIRVHHEVRLCEIVQLVCAGRQTAWDIASALTWSRPWDQINATMRRAAVSETQAHLLTLKGRGLVAPIGDDPTRWVARRAR